MALITHHLYVGVSPGPSRAHPVEAAQVLAGVRLAAVATRAELEGWNNNKNDQLGYSSSLGLCDSFRQRNLINQLECILCRSRRCPAFKAP